MNDFSWITFISDYIVGILVAITIAVATLLLGFFNGKKVSSDSIGRKNNIYLPLIEELEATSNTICDLHTKIDTKVLKELVDNNYKYAIKKAYLKK